MDSAAELKISAETDRQILQPAFQRKNRYQIRQRLCRMLMTAVTRVDQRNPTVLRSDRRRAFLGMPHSSDIRITGNHADRILDALAFCRGADVRGRESERAAAEIQHRGLKTQARSRARLIKKRGELLALRGVRILCGIFTDLLREPQDAVGLVHA